MGCVMAKFTKLLQFDSKTKQEIFERDEHCIFCVLHYHMEKALPGDCSVFDPMHVVNKSQLGLGIIQNGVKGCRYHHGLLDNGNQGLRREMEQMLKDYLRGLYPGWTEESVTYQKYEDLVVYRK